MVARRGRGIPEKGQNESMQDLQKNLEEAKQYLREVQAEIQRQEKPSGFFGKLNSALENKNRLELAKLDVHTAESEIKIAKLQAETEKLKSGGIDGFDDESEDDWDEEDED